MTENTAIGKYDIVDELGRGGMGVVYKAWEESLQRFVAIKMLGDQLVQDQTVVERFLREARAVADLNHPNVVQVFAVDTFEGRPYFAMEYVEGESLTDLIHTSQRVDPKRAVRIVREAAAGLAAAHAKEVVHRDIKPDNIMMTKHGGVKVVDFGIAKVDDPDSKLTATGMMVGTPNYISPEVCLGQDVDARSDIFSLGIVFFEMLAGETPFKADSPIAMMTAVVQAEVPDIRTLNPDVDEEMRQILSHMLHKQREFRYQGCQEIIDDLTAYLEGNEPPYATAAMEDATVAMHRPDIAADTVAAGAPQPIVKPKSAPRANRAGQVGWVLGLLLIVGAAAGSWYYVEQPPGDVGREGASPAAQVTDEVVAAADDGGETATGVAAALTGLEEQDNAAIPADAISSTPVQQASQNAGQDGFAQDPLQVEVAVLAEQPSPRTAPAAPVEIEPPPPTGPPQLVVIASGDPSISTVVESVLEGALLAADFEVMDESFFNDLRIGGFNADLAQMGQSVRANGGDVLIFADVRETGQRTLSFYGRSELQILANLQVRALLLREKRNLGAPWLASLEYVPLNASDTAREVAEPIADELVERLQAITQ